MFCNVRGQLISTNLVHCKKLYKSKNDVLSIKKYINISYNKTSIQIKNTDLIILLK